MRHLKYLPYIFHIIYFNFKYLPFRQAVRLPIFFYKPKFIRLKGKVIIDSDNIKTGMIRMGDYIATLYPNSGVVWDNNGGIVVFKGKCRIANDAKLSIGICGKVEFGHDFSGNASLKIACFHNIKFGSSVRVGWDCVFMDTDFHKIKTIDGKESKGYGPILIGANNWFGNGCLIFKNTLTNDFIIIAARSVLNKRYEYFSYSLIGGSPVFLLKEGVFRDINDDKLGYC